MPNWYFNKLWVKGDKVEIDAFIEKAKGIVYGEEYVFSFSKLTGKEEFDTNMRLNSTEVTRMSDNLVRYNFLTAWAAPTIEHITVAFPNLVFIHKFEDEFEFQTVIYREQNNERFKETLIQEDF